MPHKRGFIRILSVFVSVLVFSITVVSIITVSEIYWITTYGPQEQYSMETHKCSVADFNLTISRWHMKAIQPDNPAVVSVNEKILGNQSNKSSRNLTQEQWLRNAELIFYWITENIEYDDAKRPFPQLPDETLMNRSGECDDLSILYASMAINAGVPVDNIRLVVSGRRAGGQFFACNPAHMFAELKYVYNGKTIWVPLELTDKTSRFNQFLADLYLPGVRFYWIGLNDSGYFDDLNIGQDSTYETKIHLFSAYANDSLSLGDLKTVLVHAFNRHYPASVR